MTPELEARRRALQIIYNRYIQADRAWRLAQRDALSWFPVGRRPSVPPIGDPGSRVRRLYDDRSRVLAQLATAHQEVSEARRLSTRRIRILALTHY